MITIKFHGIELTVPPDQVGTVVRQLTEVTSALSQSVPNDLSQSDRHSQESRAAKQSRARRTLNHAAAWPFPKPSEQELSLFPVAASSASYEETTLRFLRAIEDHSLSGGLEVEQIMKLLGATHPKGVGSKTAAVNKTIESHGFQLSNVYSNSRDSAGARHWIGGPDLRAAINAIETGGRKT